MMSVATYKHAYVNIGLVICVVLLLHFFNISVSYVATLLAITP